MSDVQFEDQGQEFTSRKIFGESVKPKMVASIMKMGVVKDEKQAGQVLLAIMFLSILATLYVLYAAGFLSGPAANKPIKSLEPPMQTSVLTTHLFL